MKTPVFPKAVKQRGLGSRVNCLLLETIFAEISCLWPLLHAWASSSSSSPFLQFWWQPGQWRWRQLEQRQRRRKKHQRGLKNAQGFDQLWNCQFKGPFAASQFHQATLVAAPAHGPCLGVRQEVQLLRPGWVLVPFDIWHKLHKCTKVSELQQGFVIVCLPSFVSCRCVADAKIGRA